MVLIREFRIVSPYTLDEYKTGQKYSVAKSSRLVTKGGNGVEMRVANPLYEDGAGPETGARPTGMYTEKVYHMEAYLPGWIKKVVPASAMLIYETATDRYPYCKTVCTFPFLGERFVLTIESRHAADRGETENIHGLSPELLKKRKVVKMDFVSEQLTDKTQQLPSEDPRKFKSEKSGRGPLSSGWQKSAQPVMCAYKLVTVRCKILALQNKLEQWLMDFETQIFLRFHKQLFCWQDEWWGMTDEQLREHEERMKREMDEEIHQGLSPAERKLLDEQAHMSLHQLEEALNQGDEALEKLEEAVVAEEAEIEVSSEEPKNDDIQEASLSSSAPAEASAVPVPS